MISGVGLRFDVPSVDKAPEEYDDRVFEMDDHYQMLAQALGENDLVREQSIQQLREWIVKHPRIRHCRTDAPFLLRFLRNNKYSFMKAAKMVECYVTAMTVNKKWFTNLDLEADQDLEHLIDFGYIFPLPQRDSKGRIVLFSSSGGFYCNPHKPSMHAVVKINHMVTEIYLDTNEAQCAGFVFVYDMEKCDINVLTSGLSIMEIKQLVQLTNTASAARIQELHFINTPKTLRSIANLVLQLMSEKIRSRVFIYLDTNEAQCAGFVFVYDMEKCDINVLTSGLSIMEIKQLVQLTNTASAARIQELHFINTPKTLRSIANLVLQLMSEKIRSRVFIYLDTNEAQCAGFVFVYDMEKCDINVLTSGLSIMEIKQLVQLTNTASAARIQELHFINTPKTLRSIANLVLQLMSEKIRSRVFCHRSLESLYEVVDKTMLPKEFGGTIPMMEMTTGFKKLCQRMRPRLLSLDEVEIELSDKDNKDDAWQVSEGESASGVVGSFRKLEVD